MLMKLGNSRHLHASAALLVGEPYVTSCRLSCVPPTLVQEAFVHWLGTCEVTNGVCRGLDSSLLWMSCWMHGEGMQRALTFEILPFVQGKALPRLGQQPTTASSPSPWTFRCAPYPCRSACPDAGHCTSLLHTWDGRPRCRVWRIPAEAAALMCSASLS